MSTAAAQLSPSPILLWDRKLQEKKCDLVTDFGSDLAGLVDRLRITCKTHNGVGLAAPQIGEFVRVAVVYFPLGTELVLVNPVIDEINSKGEQIDYEACLSIPTCQKVNVRVRRCMNIIYTYQNMAGEEVQAKADGFLARAISHEVDHLSGVFYTDRIGELSRSLVMRSHVKWMNSQPQLSGGRYRRQSDF